MEPDSFRWSANGDCDGPFVAGNIRTTGKKRQVFALLECTTCHQGRISQLYLHLKSRGNVWEDLSLAGDGAGHGLEVT